MLLLLNLADCPPLARSADLPQPEYYRWGAQLQVAAAAAEAHRIASSDVAHRQAGLKGRSWGSRTQTAQPLARQTSGRQL